MRYIIYGAGAIGEVLGGKLHMSGKDVVLIARGAHLDAIQRDGLEVVTPDGNRHNLPVQAVGRPAELRFGPDDVVFLAMKSQDTEAALDELRREAGEVPIFCCQNGVANERMATRRFDHVYGVVVMVAGNHLEPGVVEAGLWPRSGILDLGFYPKGDDSLAWNVSMDLNASGFDSRVLTDIMPWKYAKLAENTGNVVAAVVKAGDDASDLAARIQEEVRAAYAAAGIIYIPDDEFMERNWPRREIMAVPRKGGSSTWQSLARGAGSIEVDYLNGEIALIGRTYGVPTPVNEAFQYFAQGLASHRLPPGSIPVEQIRAEIARREARPSS